MLWCGKDEDIGSFTDGPTLCFLQSFLCELFNLFFIGIFFYRITQLVNRVTFDFIEDQTRLLLRIFQFLIILELSLSTAFGFVESESYSAAFYVITEAITWFCVFVIVTLEVWKIQRWPWIVIKIYLGGSLFADIMISSIVLHDKESSSVAVAICFSQMLVDVFLLIIALCKDLVRTPDDLAKEELKRYSVEFLGSAPMRRSHHHSNEPSPNTLQKLWKFFRSKEASEGISGREIRLRSSAAETKRWTIFGPTEKPSISASKAVDSDIINLIGDNEEHDMERSSFRSSMSNISFAESAIERNSLGSGSGNSRNKESSILKSIFTGWGGQKYRVLSDEDESERKSPLLSRDHQETILFMKEEPPRYIPTKAINRVFQENRAKISASNPVLEPRGSETSIVFTSYTENSRNDNQNVHISRESIVGNKTPFSDSETVIKYNVSVQRWGIRNRKHTPDPSAAPTPVPFGGSDAALEKVKSLDNLVSANDLENYSFDKQQKSEIEFEINMTALLLTGKSDGSTGLNEKDWGDPANIEKTTQKWTVWRTAVEVHKLHAMMLSQLGDLTPRPPRLISTQSTSTNFTHAELISDMRAITIFLNALLRLKDGTTTKPIVDFLELEKAKLLFTRSELSFRPTFQDPNDRIENLPSRNSETQESVTGAEIESRTGKSGIVGTEITSGNNSPKGPSSATTMRTNPAQSLMDVAEQDAANNPSNQHEKWRKLFYQMRIKLKPHDIAVRCRLFEGVISGGEIAAWLIRSTSAAGADAIVTDQQANTRAEACAIGQELVTCGLITPVCVGFTDEEHDLDLDAFDLEVTTDRTSMMQIKGNKNSAEDFSKFSDLSGYIFRLPVKSGTAGSWSLFGANISIKIPMMTMADENENLKSTRETVVLTIDNGVLAAEGEIEPTAAAEKSGAGGHVKYVIDITHGDDTWQTVKRYREFEALHRSLAKEGVRPEAPLPSKSFVNALARPVGFAKATLNDARRAGLETYLSSVVQAVIDDGKEKTKLLLAQFLDEDFNNLRLVNTEPQANY